MSEELKEREEFEAHRRARGLEVEFLERYETSGNYKYQEVQVSWESWQARARLNPPGGDTTDDFNGDNLALIRSAKSLLALDAQGALSPHGIGGHARTIIGALVARMENKTPGDCVAVPRELLADLLDEGPRSKTWAAQDKVRALLARLGKE